MFVMSAAACTCLACTGTPIVTVAVEHDALRQLTVALLSRDEVTWELRPCSLTEAPETATAGEAQIAVVATADFPAACRGLLNVLPAHKIVVIGPEPEGAYERAALDAGAGAWLPRDRIGDDLPCMLRKVLGCSARMHP